MAKTQQTNALTQWELNFTLLLITATKAVMCGEDFQEYRQAEELHIETSPTVKLGNGIILYDTLSRLFGYKVYPKAVFDEIRKFKDTDFVNDDIEPVFLNYIAHIKSKDLTSGFAKNVYHMVKPSVKIGIIGNETYMISEMLRFVPGSQATTVETDKLIVIKQL